MKKLLAKSAWVIYWQVMGGSTHGVKDGDVVTVFSSRIGEAKACDMLEILYKEHAYSLEECIEYRQIGKGPYKVSSPLTMHKIPVSGLEYSIGNNPMLTLRKVEDLRSDGHILSWKERGVIHPEWLCNDLGYEDCPLKGLPPKMISKELKLSARF